MFNFFFICHYCYKITIFLSRKSRGLGGMKLGFIIYISLKEVCHIFSEYSKHTRSDNTVNFFTLTKLHLNEKFKLKSITYQIHSNNIQICQICSHFHTVNKVYFWGIRAPGEKHKYILSLHLKTYQLKLGNW